MKHVLRNSEAVLIEEKGALFVESGRRYPVDMGVLTLTSRCTLACPMCLEPVDVSRGRDLAPERAMRLVETFAGKVPKIWSCAGESLLHPAFFELALEIRRRGSLVGVGTNGLALAKPGVVRRCADAGIKWLHISCHTSRPERFARLSGRGAPSLFKTFVQGLDRVDAWNRDHPSAERFEVILQLVLMKGFLEELDDYLAFVLKHLAHSPVMLRVEPMQAQGRALDRPDLRMDLGELAGAVSGLLERRSPRLGLEFKSVPLCLLPGAEALSEDLRRLGGGAYRVGNLSCESAELQLVCAIGDPARSAGAALCASCALEPLCPGLLDLPVPAGSAWPRPCRTGPGEILARAGLGPEYLRRKEAPPYPADADVPRPGGQESGMRRRETAEGAAPPTPLLAMNAALAFLPHDAAVRRAIELLCKGSPILRTGSACDLKCTYCCVGADGPALQPVGALRLRLDALSSLGHRGVGYMGGEPTLHPKFLHVVRHARSLGFSHQMLCTNGIRLGDAAFAARVFEAGVDSVTTSLDAFDTKVQEPLYGGRAAHAQALDGLEHALAAPGVEVLLSAVITAANAPLLPGYMDEVARRQDRHGKPVGVMLCALQQPASAGAAQKTLTLGMLEAARLVDKALSRARENAVAAFTFGYPACLLEAEERHLSEFYASEWELDLATGAIERSRLHDPETRWAACAVCPHAGWCPGVMRQYADAAVRARVESRGAARR